MIHINSEEMIKNYFEHFCEFWLPIYKYQVNECKIENNKNALSEIMLNLVKNIHLTDKEKRYLAKEMGLYYLIEEKEIRDDKNELFKKHEKLIYLVLKKKNLLHEIDDLYDIGMIGLLNGINTYDKTKGYQESTYYSKCILNEIRKHFYTQDRVKRKCPGVIISLDKPNEEGKENLSNTIPDEKQNIEKIILKKEQEEVLYKALEKLPSEWRFILEKRFGLYNQKEYKLSELADMFGVTKQAIGHKEKSALRKLKEILRKEMAYE